MQEFLDFLITQFDRGGLSDNSIAEVFKLFVKRAVDSVYRDTSYDLEISEVDLTRYPAITIEGTFVDVRVAASDPTSRATAAKVEVFDFQLTKPEDSDRFTIEYTPQTSGVTQFSACSDANSEASMPLPQIVQERIHRCLKSNAID